jgi:UDP-N-acetylglucosamine:(glucosyl)LPS alpha-1,2-N-acetylglucosaminyltransferase
VAIDPNNIKLVSYVPHGAVPDIRGFAPSIVAYNLTKNLKQISAVTICNRETYRKEYEVDSEIGPIYRIKEGRIYRRLFRKITKLDPYPLHARAAKIVNSVSPDIFHAHQLEFPVDDFLRRLDKKIPLVIHSHGVNIKLSPKRGNADLYIAVSKYAKNELVENGYPEKIIEVIHNGVDTEMFKPALPDEKRAIKNSLNVPEDTFVISFIGRMQEGKGVDVFLQAAGILLSKYPQLYVFTVGPEPDNAKKEKRYGWRTNLRRQLSLVYGKRYNEFPRLPHSSLSDIYKITDIAYLPSLYDLHPLVIIESMASGCITVSSNVGGIKESISHGSTGFLIDKPDSVEEGVQLIEEIIDHTERYESIKSNARQFIVDNFDWKISAVKMEKLYFDLLNDK